VRGVEAEADRVGGDFLLMEHPITPPPELAAKWVSEIYGDPAIPLHPITLCLVDRAAQWGADQELVACCTEVSWFTADILRAARRPKPPSLKEQALGALEHLALIPDPPGFIADMDTIRRALEQLND